MSSAANRLYQLFLMQQQAQGPNDDRKTEELDLSRIRENDISYELHERLGNSSSGKMLNTYHAIMKRVINPGQRGQSEQTQRHISQRFIPNTLTSENQYRSRVFCGKFSSDGDLFMTATQDRKIQIYNTDKALSSLSSDNPYTRGGVPTWKPFREIEGRHVGWSILDVDYSPDNRFVAYSTWSHFVQLCNIYGDYELHENLPFTDSTGRFCLFSIKFSPDNREIIGGSNDDCVYVYDIERKERIVQLQAHEDDINTVCFADEDANLLVTGSDDAMCKVFDRRLLGASNEVGNQRPVGVFVGHFEGITHVDSKGDGRYFLTNGKDQCMKLWDIRKLKEESERERESGHGVSQYDYRWGGYRRRANEQLEGDNSIMTYTGHSVYETLVRCHFSPKSTGNRYVYTGSHSGNVYIYDLLTGELVSELGQENGHDGVVRDVSWHPHYPLILSSAWDGRCILWEYRSGEEGEEGEEERERERERAREERQSLLEEGEVEGVDESMDDDTTEEEESDESF